MNWRFIFIAAYLICICMNVEAQTFIEYADNPVIDTLRTTDQSEFWTRWKSDPCVIHWSADSLSMYYGTNNYGVSTQIGTAVSADGNNWVEKRRSSTSSWESGKLG